MKNKVYWVICICPLWLFLSNCVDKFNAHLPESSIGLLIVEGSIISDSAVVFFFESVPFPWMWKGFLLISIRWMLKFV